MHARSRTAREARTVSGAEFAPTARPEPVENMPPFGTCSVPIPEPVVTALREEGHSLRAIAGAVGVTQTQVARDLAGVTEVTPQESRGLDGKTRKARPARAATTAKRAALAERDGHVTFKGERAVPCGDCGRVFVMAGLRLAATGNRLLCRACWSASHEREGRHAS